MRHAMTVLICLGFLLGWLAWNDQWKGAQAQEGEQASAVGNLGFGQLIAGTWLNEEYTLNGVSFPGFCNLVTMGADGTYTTTETNDYDVILPDGNGFESPQHGSWIRTGPRELTSAQLHFDFDRDGTLEQIVKVHVVGTFAADFNSGYFEYSMEVYPVGSGLDPLTDDGYPVGGGTFTGRRLRV